MGEIIGLPGTEEPGKPVKADHERTDQMLPGRASAPVMSAEPMAAWTHAVFDAAKANEQ